MLIVSASLKKSGTGWLYNMLNDLLVAAGHEDSRALRDRYGLDDVVKGWLCHAHPRWPLIRRVLPLLRRGETLAVSTHSGPNPELLALMALGLAKATYLYRDPRDAALSILDHGERVRRVDADWEELASLEGVEDAARYIAALLPLYRRWSRVPGVLLLRYGDLLADAVGQLRRLARHLGLAVPEPTLAEVAGRYAKSKVAGEYDETSWGPEWNRLHFNKGVAGRYAEELSAAELAVCERHFGPYLRRMGYAS